MVPRTKKKIVQACITAIIMAAPLLAHAQSDTPNLAALSTEEMMLFQEIPSVFGASKYEQKVTEAPSSVSIVTASEIKKNGYRTLADILRSVRSFYVTNDRNYSYVGVRGFGRPGDYNSRILLLIDGHRTNDNIYDQALVGTEALIDADIIDRIEVIRGPGSSLYGSNAFFAVVNVITKRGRNLKGAEVSGEAGSFKTYKGSVTYGNKFQNGVEAIVSGSGFDSKGDQLFFSEFNTPATNNGATENTDFDQSQNLFTKLSYQDFTLAGVYAFRTKGIPTGAFGTDFNDPGNKTVDQHAYLDLKYDHQFGRETDIAARVFYDSMSYTGSYLYGGVLNKDLGNGVGWGGEAKIITKVHDAHRIIMGADYQNNTRQDQKTYDVNPYTLYLDDKRSGVIWASYIQDEYPISKALLLNAGVRYDHYDTFGGATNPRLALIYAPLEKSTLKLLYGGAFRAPNEFELHYASATSVANPDLKPETIKTYELVYEQYLGDHFRAAASSYYYRINGLINQDETAPGSGITVFKNLDAVEARGFELELDNRWANGIEGRFSYTIQRTTDMTTDQPLENSPGHLAKLNLTIPLLKDSFSASIEEQFMSRRRTIGNDFAPALFLTNVTFFTRRLQDHLELSASIYNLLDKKYGDPVSADLTPLDTVQQDGRNYRIKLTYAF